MLTMQGTLEGVVYERFHSLLVQFNVEHQIMSVYGREERSSIVRHFILAEHEGMGPRQLLIENALHENVITLLARAVGHCLKEAAAEAATRAFFEPGQDEEDNTAVSQYIPPEPTLDDGWMPEQDAARSELRAAHPRHLYGLAMSPAAQQGVVDYFEGPLQPNFRVYQGEVHTAQIPDAEPYPIAVEDAEVELETPASQVGPCRFAQTELEFLGLRIPYAASEVGEDDEEQVPTLEEPVEAPHTGGRSGSYHTAGSAAFQAGHQEEEPLPSLRTGSRLDKVEGGEATTSPVSNRSRGRANSTTHQPLQRITVDFLDDRLLFNREQDTGRLPEVEDAAAHTPSSTATERGAKVSTAVVTAFREAVDKCNLDANLPLQALQASIDRVEQAVTALNAAARQDANHGVEEATLHNHLVSVRDAICSFVDKALEESRKEIGTSLGDVRISLQDFRMCLLEKLASLESIPVMGRPVMPPGKHAMQTTAQVTSTVMDGPAIDAVYPSLGSTSGHRPEEGLRMERTREAAPPVERRGKDKAPGRSKEDKPESKSRRVPNDRDPDDSGGDSSDDEDEGQPYRGNGSSDSEDSSEEEAPPRRRRRATEVSTKRLQINTRTQMDFRERLGGGGEKDLQLLTAIGRWTIAFNNLFKVVMPPGWKEVEGRRKQELFRRTVAHMLPATLKDPALTGVQMMVTTRRCAHPRDIPRLVYKWCFPAQTGVDAAEQALNVLTLSGGVVEFEQALRICTMAKFELDLGRTPSFTGAQYKEMLMVIRRATRGTPSEQAVHLLHTLANHNPAGVNYADLVQQCLDELTQLEALHGRQHLRKPQPSHNRSATSYQSPARSSRGDSGRYSEEDREKPRVQAMERRDARSNQDWRTSPESGAMLLKGPPPPEAKSDSRTLLEALSKENRCFWCTKTGHDRRNCPERRAQRGN